MASALERRFQLAQSQLKRQESGRQLEEERAMKRQFAQAGAIGSGAAIKAGMEQRARGAERLQSGMLGLEAEKLGQQYQEEQAEKQRGFITSERLGSQQYSTAEREAAQKYARGERLSAQEYNTLERLGTQDFQNLQREESQKFLTGERLDTQDFQNLQREESQKFVTGERKEGQLFTDQQRVKTQNFQKGLFDIEQVLKEKEFDINKFITMENLNMARRTLGLDPLTGFPGDKKTPFNWTGIKKKSSIENLSQEDKEAMSAPNVRLAWDRQVNQRVLPSGRRITNEEYEELQNIYAR